MISASDDHGTIVVDAAGVEFACDGSHGEVTVILPTHAGEMEFSISFQVEADQIVVTMPFLAEDGVRRLPSGHDIANGIIYLGTPDEVTEDLLDPEGAGYVPERPWDNDGGGSE